MNNQLIAMHEPLAIKYLEQMENATHEDRLSAKAAFSDSLKERRPILQINSNTAILTIEGTLSKNGPSALALYFGYTGTGYLEIIEACEELISNSSVEEVTVNMDTGGGFVEGLDEAFQALLDLNKAKNVKVINKGMVASAGYYLAASIRPILAQTPAVLTGSIGVKIVGYDWSKYDAELGIKRVAIISSGAPKKDRTLETKQGIAVLQEEVNSMERIFHARVAEGRGISVDKVKSDFGQGGILVANDPDPKKDDALSVGMIDAILGKNLSVAINKKPESKTNSKGASASGINDSANANINSKADVNQKRGDDTAITEDLTVSKTLKILLAENPDARAEHDAALVTAQNGGFEKGQADVQAKVDKRVKFAQAALGAEQSYPKTINSLAVKVMLGESEASALESAMASVDAVREEMASEKAKGETGDLGKTKGQQQKSGKADGVAENEDDFQAQLNASLSNKAEA